MAAANRDGALKYSSRANNCPLSSSIVHDDKAATSPISKNVVASHSARYRMSHSAHMLDEPPLWHARTVTHSHLRYSIGFGRLGCFVVEC